MKISNTEIGMAFEYLATGDEVITSQVVNLCGREAVMSSPLNGVVRMSLSSVMEKCCRNNKETAQRLNAAYGKPLSHRLSLIPYEYLGKAAKSDELVKHLISDKEFCEVLRKRSIDIQLGNFFEREEEKQEPTHEERRREFFEELLVEAATACEENGIIGAEISIEKVSPDETDDFVKANGAAQLVIMDNGTKAVGIDSDIFGVVIRNSNGQIVKGVMSRVATLSLKMKTDSDESDECE